MRSGMEPTIDPRVMGTGSDSIERRLERLRALLRMGGTMENQGVSLHLGDLRMDVRTIADMNEEAWTSVLSSLTGRGADR